MRTRRCGCSAHAGAWERHERHERHERWRRRCSDRFRRGECGAAGVRARAPLGAGAMAAACGRRRRLAALSRRGGRGAGGVRARGTCRRPERRRRWWWWRWRRLQRAAAAGRLRDEATPPRAERCGDARCAGRRSWRRGRRGSRRRRRRRRRRRWRRRRGGRRGAAVGRCCAVGAAAGVWAPQRARRRAATGRREGEARAALHLLGAYRRDNGPAAIEAASLRLALSLVAAHAPLHAHAIELYDELQASRRAAGERRDADERQARGGEHADPAHI